MKGNRLLVPAKLWEQIIQTLHETHLGITKTKQLAHDTVCWPSIDLQITNHIDR